MGWSKFCKFLRKHNRRRIRGFEEGIVIGQFLHLLVNGFGNLLAAMTDIRAPETRHSVEITFAVRILEPDPFGLDDDAAAFLGQRLVVRKRMHVMARVGRTKRGGRIAV